MIVIKIEPFPENAANQLKKIINKLSSRESLMKKIAAQLADAVEDNFAQQGRPRWLPLSPKTIKARRSKKHWGSNAKILQDTGALASSVSSRSSDTEAIVGTNLIYAPVHQFGGDIFVGARHERFNRQRFVRGAKKGKFKKMKSYKIGAGFNFKSYVIHIPARPFLSITPNDIDSIKTTVINYLT